MTRKQVIYGKKTALQLTLIISVIFIFITLITYAYARSQDLGKSMHLQEVFTIKSGLTFLMNTLLLYILFRFQFWANKNYLHPRKKGLITVFGSLALVLILSPLFSQIQWLLFVELIPVNVYLTIHMVKDLVILLITLLFTALIFLWDKSQETLIKNQKLSIESLQNRYDALKSQVDPHFLFNSLNTLNGLIGYDDDKAHDYLEQLSSVFRYTMQNKQVIQLADELEFAESYVYMMKIRYNDSLQIEYNPEEKYKKYYILPFGLQVLIENAIKHNVISNKYPLMITIETTDKDTIRVKNNIRLKPDSPSSGIGLANLNERYQLLFNKEIEINQNEDYFMVEIPLIKDIEKATKKSIEENYESCHC